MHNSIHQHVPPHKIQCRNGIILVQAIIRVTVYLVIVWLFVNRCSIGINTTSNYATWATPTSTLWKSVTIRSAAKLIQVNLCHFHTIPLETVIHIQKNQQTKFKMYKSINRFYCYWLFLCVIVDTSHSFQWSIHLCACTQWMMYAWMWICACFNPFRDKIISGP